MAKCQRDWDEYRELLKYAYNAQAHRAKNLTAFSFDLSRQPADPTTLHSRTASALTPATTAIVYYLHFELNCYEELCLCDKTRITEQNRRKNDVRTTMTKMFCNVQLSLIAGKYVHFDCPRLYSSGAEHLAIELYNKLLPEKLGHLK